MALAKRLLRGSDLAIEQVAENVGYSSASTFTVAFVRHIGMPPARYAPKEKNATAPLKSLRTSFRSVDAPRPTKAVHRPRVEERFCKDELERAHDREGTF
ncbi:helix-turn-helix domain-containing protein [Terriglobus sp. 2YAB30_2]|uniref:helix-turn-helix domain-containing protein n=1 Tax=Terriglobus sp. 2YAB30_2 TaxID=3233023 RepID=UPI003F9D3F9C